MITKAFDCVDHNKLWKILKKTGVPDHLTCLLRNLYVHQEATVRWRTVWRFLKKLELALPYDPAIPLLGTHTEEIRYERDTCTPMFITALFTIARTWKQPRCLSADKWIRKLWYIHTMEYYSVIKKNETAKETLMYRTVLWTLWERERVGRFGRMALKHVKYHV